MRDERCWKRWGRQENRRHSRVQLTVGAGLRDYSSSVFTDSRRARSTAFEKRGVRESGIRNFHSKIVHSVSTGRDGTGRSSTGAHAGPVERVAKIERVSLEPHEAVTGRVPLRSSVFRHEASSPSYTPFIAPCTTSTGSSTAALPYSPPVNKPATSPRRTRQASKSSGPRKGRATRSSERRASRGG